MSSLAWRSALMIGCGAVILALSPLALAQQKLMTPADLQALPAKPPDHRVMYGDVPIQVGELRVPAGRGPHPVAVLIHGGCWRAPLATLRDLAPMGDALKAAGIASWNIEYRRLGQPGGGWPGTYQDVGRAIDALRRLAPTYALDLSRVAVVGHSAGGHLAMWAAARQRLPRSSPLFVADPLPLRGVLNLAGTIDMFANIAHMEEKCGDAVVTKLMGGRPAAVADRYEAVSAGRHLPLGVPQMLVWGEHEDFVARELAERYADAAVEAGDRVRLQVIPGAGHFELASPKFAGWPRVLGYIRLVLGM